ncbi:hypothetical protein [Methylocapsa palsarum]|uniref:Uncharacterized protein n=1 Tax=Methylocapsa palsarum TaxID=1612308 RepID=A0A1I4CVM9_9HYPH|nr:hypothetical protein [Methylocapsa palsarum]SFK85302.1 hypothetical protein SAMN05444581_13012 [Methylocapsa palsarum]
MRLSALEYAAVFLIALMMLGPLGAAAYGALKAGTADTRSLSER